MKTIQIIVCGLFLSSLSWAKVIEVRYMEQVMPYVNSNSWVVFDLDNTVMEPKQTLGSDQWFEFMVKKLGSGDAAIKVWERVQRVTKMQVVETHTPRLVGQTQGKATRVFALTARPDNLSETTKAQLNSLGVEFAQVVSVGPESSKGAELKRLVQEAPLRPSRVVFVDDKLKHTTSVNAAMDELGIENFEFRYGAADEKVKAFDSTLAEVELCYFEKTGIILSDEEAKYENCE